MKDRLPGQYWLGDAARLAGRTVSWEIRRIATLFPKVTYKKASVDLHDHGEKVP